MAKASTMTPQSTSSKPKSLFRTAVRAVAVACACLIAVLIVTHFVWKYSGSNQWVFVSEKDGVRVYSLKAPGVSQEQFRGVTRISTTLNRVVAAMTDTSTEACREFVPGCTSGRILQPWDPETHAYTQAYRVIFPRPLSPRDLVVQTQFSQDPGTKSVLVQCTALPDLLPRDSCCRRVTDMHNSWRFTPVGNGLVEVEFTYNADPTIPYFLFNRAAPASFPRLLRHLEAFYNNDKYQHTTFAFVQEP